MHFKGNFDWNVSVQGETPTTDKMATWEMKTRDSLFSNSEGKQLDLSYLNLLKRNV